MNESHLSDGSRNPVTDHLDLWTSVLLVKSTAGRGNNGRLEAYGIKKLRELILELAVRGKLLPQYPKDEPAAELLKRVQSDKERMIKSGEISKDKDFPEIGENEKPFDCPSSWQWARINDVGHDLGQKTPDTKFTYIDVSAIDNSRGAIDAPTIMEASEAPSRARKIIKKGTVIYSTIRPYLKNICVLDVDYSPEPIASTAFAILHPFQDMPGKFFAMYFRSPEFVRYVEMVQTGIAYPAINDKQFYGGLVPVPPLAEQHRIVAKVDELMALCDQLERQQGRGIEAHQTLVETLLGTMMDVESDQEFAEAWSRIAENFDVLFNTEKSIDQLKGAILQLAVMGRLVHQEANDEPSTELLKRIRQEKSKLVAEGVLKKSGPLIPISAEEKPFELPENWSWVRLGEVLNKITDGTHHSPLNTSTGDFKYISAKNIKPWGLDLTDITYVTAEVHQEIYSRCDPEFGDVLYIKDGATTGIGVINSLSEPFSMLSSVALLKPSIGINNYYLLNTLIAPLFYDEMRAGMTGVAITRVTLSKLNEAIIPLPPLAEQIRIVTKVKEMMDLCDLLKDRFAEAQTTKIYLADAIVERATV